MTTELLNALTWLCVLGFLLSTVCFFMSCARGKLQNTLISLLAMGVTLHTGMRTADAAALNTYATITPVAADQVVMIDDPGGTPLYPRLASVTSLSTAIDHDTTVNFVANEHIDWTAGTANDVVIADDQSTGTSTIKWLYDDAGDVSTTANLGVNDTTPDAQVDLEADSAVETVLNLQMAAAATADPFTVRNSSGSVLFRVIEDGHVGIGADPTTKSLMIAAAAGSNPTLWTKDGDVAHGVTQYGFTTDTLLSLTSASGTAGGAIFAGFSDTAGVTAIDFWGTNGGTPTAPAVCFTGGKASGTSFGDLAAGEIIAQFSNGVNTPTHVVEIFGNGDMDIDGAINVGGGDDLVAMYTGSATLNFSNLSPGAAETLTITVMGAADSDPVSLGIPNAVTHDDLDFRYWVSAADTVSVTCRNISSASMIDPASATYKAIVHAID